MGGWDRLMDWVLTALSAQIGYNYRALVAGIKA